MKLLKSMAIISLASLFTLSNAYADNNQKQSKQQTKQTQKQTKQSKKSTEPTPEQSLKMFNDSFGIRFVGHKVANDQTGKPQLLLKYEFTNKSNKGVRAVKFIGGFTYNQQMIYAQEVPLTFNTPLKAKEKVVLDIAVPFEKVPEKARPILLDSNAKIGTLNGAQALVFSDKTGILLK